LFQNDIIIQQFPWSPSTSNSWKVWYKKFSKKKRKSPFINGIFGCLF
jgi:hypothetical protein